MKNEEIKKLGDSFICLIKAFKGIVIAYNDFSNKLREFEKVNEQIKPLIQDRKSKWWEIWKIFKFNKK